MSRDPSLDPFRTAAVRLADAVPRAVRRRFALKLGALFLVVVLIIAAVGANAYLATGKTLSEDTEEQLVGATQLQSETVNDWVHRMEDHSRFVAHSIGESGDEAGITASLREEQDRLPDYVVGVHYVDTSTTDVLASTSDDVAGTQFGDRDVPWLEAATEGHGDDGHGAHGESAHRTRPYDDPYADAPAMAFVTELDDRDDRAVVLVVDLEERSEALERSSSDRWTHVVNAEGTIVLSHESGKIGEQNMGGEGVDSMGVERGLEGETGYVEMEMMGRPVSMGYSPVEAADWVVMTHVETADAFALQRDILGSITLLVTVALVGLAAIGLTMGRNTARALGALAGKAEALEAGDLDVPLESRRIDEIGRLYESFDSMRVSLRGKIEEAEAARQEAEAARQEAEALTRHLESKAQEYERVMEACAEGDMTRRMDPESESEAMRAIAASFNGMMDRLEDVTHDLKGFAEDVAAASEEVTASSEEIQSSSDEVADSVQAISDGATRQSETLQSVAEEMNTLSTTIEEMAASANKVAETADRTAETGADARETAEDAVAKMERVERESEAAVEAIEALLDQMGEIEEVTEFITDVAEQTNILALNANIEAARAGEAGEGFAVVADQVKELAEETREAAAEIEGLVEGVREQTAHTADEVRTTSDVVGRSTEAVEETVAALQEIADDAEEANTGIQEISAATQQQAASTNEVVSMVDDAAVIAEQTAEEASTVAGASEEQTAAISELTNSAGSLASEADRLRESLDGFVTDPDGAPERPEEHPVVGAEDD